MAKLIITQFYKILKGKYIFIDFFIRMVLSGKVKLMRHCESDTSCLGILLHSKLLLI